MGMYITGDVHGGFDMAKIEDWEGGREGDCLIVAGDFVFPWDFSEGEREDIRFLESRPYTVLFVDGNHEHFGYWGERPVEEWHCGLVQRLSARSPIRRLMRGEVYDIEGSRIFTMGGAASVDRDSRTPFVDWWPHELPDERNFAEARERLGGIGWEVDYVVTHTCATRFISPSLQVTIGYERARRDRLTEFLDELEDRLMFKHWYYGHFHRDLDVDARHTLLYDEIVRLGEGVGGEAGSRQPF